MNTEDFYFLSSIQHTHLGLLRLTKSCTGLRIDAPLAVAGG
jgi:hypothetical protein